MLIKKTIGVLTASSLVFGLAACNANDNDRAFDPTDNNNGVRTIDVRNNPNDLNNDLNDWNDLNMPNRNTLHNERMDISASHTSINSDKYPETRAQLVQDAKYKFIQVDPRQGGTFPSGQIQGQNKQVPTGQQQGQYGQAPDGQPAGQQQAQNQTPAQTEQPQTQTTAGISQYARQVIDLTNKERVKQGLSALKADAKLSGVAQKKSQDMQQNNYFSHTSPTYGSPFDMMRDFGVTYTSAAENIAQGQQTPQEVVNAWMNSSGHRANIMNKSFTHIGVGFEKEGKNWTQMFIGK